jgi:hypothetical protein
MCVALECAIPSLLLLLLPPLSPHSSATHPPQAQSVLKTTHPGAVSSTRGPSICTRIAEGNGSGSGSGSEAVGGAARGLVVERIGGLEVVVFVVEVELGGIGGVEEREEVKSWSQ